jgi:hypothetical protein
MGVVVNWVISAMLLVRASVAVPVALGVAVPVALGVAVPVALGVGDDVVGVRDDVFGVVDDVVLWVVHSVVAAPRSALVLVRRVSLWCTVLSRTF